jgi:hypothetical protein
MKFSNDLAKNVGSFTDLHTAIKAAAAAAVKTIRGTSERLSKHPIRKEKNTQQEISLIKATAYLSKDTGRG